MISREIKVGDRLRWDDDEGTIWFRVAKIEGDYLIDEQGDRWLVTPGNRLQYSHINEPQTDPVNHPPHYTAGDIECIDAIRAALGREGFIAYCRGNVIKYVWRCVHKCGVEDLKKAKWYQEKAIKEAGE
jgi:hypothetical protein